MARPSRIITTMRSTQRDDEPKSVLARAFALLTCFTANDTDLSLAKLASRTGIPKATVHRLVGQLAQCGAVERTPAGVRLGMRLFELGQLAPRHRDLREAALPHMEDLARATAHTVHLAVLDGTEVVYLEKLTGRHGPPLPSRVGGRMAAHCTGVGKALLAFSPAAAVNEVVASELVRRTPHTITLPAVLRRELADIRRSGLAFDREESTPGVVCVACPVFGPTGAVVAAVSITGWSNRLDTGRVASAVRTATLAISRQLGAVPPPYPRSGSAGAASSSTREVLRSSII
jgi:DNA-binding IclR family transcriptional regulator